MGHSKGAKQFGDSMGSKGPNNSMGPTLRGHDKPSRPRGRIQGGGGDNIGVGREGQAMLWGDRGKYEMPPMK